MQTGPLFDNDPTTGGSSEGDLTGPASGTTASRDSYTVNWYDLARRPTTSADYGTDGSITSAPASPPGRSAVTGTATGGSTFGVDS